MVYIKLNRRHVASILFFFSITLLTVCAGFLYIFFNAKSFLIFELPANVNSESKTLEIFSNAKEITKLKDKNERQQWIDYKFNLFNKTDVDMRNSPPHSTNTLVSTPNKNNNNILVQPTKSLQENGEIKSTITQLQYEVGEVNADPEETIYIDDFDVRSPYLAHPNQHYFKAKEQLQKQKSSEANKTSNGILLNTKKQNVAENSVKLSKHRNSLSKSKIPMNPAITAIDDEDLTTTSSGSGDFENVNSMLASHYDYETIPSTANKKIKTISKAKWRNRLNSKSYNLQRNDERKRRKKKCKTSAANRTNCSTTDISTDSELTILIKNFSTPMRSLEKFPTQQRTLSKTLYKSKNIYDTIDNGSELGKVITNNTSNGMEIKTRRVMGNFKKSKERSRQLLLCEEAGGGELCRMLFKDNETD